MRPLLSVLLLVSCFWVRSQKPEAGGLLSPAAMTADFDYLRQALESTAPGLYAHQSPERVGIIFDSVRATLQKEPLSMLQFYKKIAFIIAELHCEHSQALPGGSAEKLFKDFRFFPFQPDFTGPHAIVIINGTRDTTIQPGDEIISINGQSIDSIRTAMYRYLPGDGFITTGKAHSMSSMTFGFFYNLFIEQAAAYDAVFKSRGGRLIHRNFSTGLGITDINKNAADNPVNQRVFEASKRYATRRKQPFTLELVPEKQAAFLTVRTFGADKTPFEHAIDSLFTLVREKGVRTLVIDLSYNDGGEEERAAYLLSYLVNQPTRYADSEYLLNDKDAWLALANIPAKIRKNKYDYIEPMKNGKSMVKLSEYSMELATIQPKPGRFTGKVYLYVNGGTASSASTFAAVAQSNHLAVIVGEETAGSYKGGGIAIGINLQLPNSGIHTHTSLAFMHFATTGRNGSRGVIPDHPFIPGFDEMVGDGMGWRRFVMGLF